MITAVANAAEVQSFRLFGRLMTFPLLPYSPLSAVLRDQSLFLEHVASLFLEHVASLNSSDIRQMPALQTARMYSRSKRRLPRIAALVSFLPFRVLA
jgi:hypothetical protein